MQRQETAFCNAAALSYALQSGARLAGPLMEIAAAGGNARLSALLQAGEESSVAPEALPARWDVQAQPCAPPVTAVPEEQLPRMEG